MKFSKFFFFGILTLFSSKLFVNAQNTDIKHFTIEWEGVKTFEIYKDYSVSLPSVKDGSLDMNLLLPYYLQIWEVPYGMHIKEFSLKNVVYQDLPLSEKADLNLSKIAKEPEVLLQAVSTNLKSDAYLKLFPLVYQNNQLRKIVSFDIVYSLEIAKNPIKTTRSNSVLASGNWYKIQVDTTGVYRIDTNFLSSLGINVSNINPKNIQLYGNGGAMLPNKIGDFRYDDLFENAIYVSGENDNHFDDNDYILFYAQGPDTWKHYNSAATLQHQKNIYSDKAYYFINIADNAGKRITEAPVITGTASVTFLDFDHYWFYEKDGISITNIGQRWFGDDKFHLTNEKTISYTLPDLNTAQPVKIKTCVAGNSDAVSFQVKLNGNLLQSHSISGVGSHTLAAESIQTSFVTATQPTFNLTFTYNNSGNSVARGFIDYIEIIGKQQLIAQNKQFGFRNFEAVTASGIVNYSIQNANNIFGIWEVTTPTEPKFINNYVTGGSTFQFNATAGSFKEYVLLNHQNFYTPTKPADYQVANQNLHSLNNIDYLIITDQEYVSDAETLANFHRERSGWNVQVVPLHKIYLEFGSGSPDVTAIRDFVKYIYDRSNNRLKYLLLYGDASFDYKGLKYEKSIVPVLLSYSSFNSSGSFVTDDFYGTVSDSNEGDFDANSFQTIDVAVGRIPFRNHEEATQFNAKIFNYQASVSLGDWRNEMLMVADDADVSTDSQLINHQEEAADLSKIVNQSINIKKAWLDAYQQEISSGVARYPSVNTLINNYIEKGILVFSYFGHGGETGLAQERIVETNQINDWNNKNHLNLFSVISCEFARFDNPDFPNSAGEIVLRNPNGGAVHEISTAREIGIWYGYEFNKKLIPNLVSLNNTHKSISEILKETKNTTFDQQRLFVYSFGDPSLKLAIPKPDVKITKMNNIPVTQSLDTIKALSRVKFEGIVTKADGTVDPTFNGEVYLTVFDKPQDKTTLQNDPDALLVTFDTQDSKLFRGRSQVVNGEFTIEFVAPQDIRIAYGYGKLSFYAHNNSIDRGGYDKSIIIGGVNYNAAADNKGPEIKLYMNDTSFVDGGNTNQSPLFIAHLYDENGINTSFSAVDHDITAILDNKTQEPMVLNEYYVTDLNDFTKGSLEYRLRDLSIGHHTISLKAYDNYNNSSEALLNFIVVDDAELVLDHVLNYPNPFIDYTEFWFDHNHPNEPLEVMVQIYTVSGKLVKTLQKTVFSSDTHSRDLTWNGLDDFGQKIGKGVYVYKISVSAPQSDLKKEIFEKLVILQ